MSLDFDIPSIHGLNINEAMKAFSATGWQALKNNPGQNAEILFSACGRYVVRIAENDRGFEEFAAMCETHTADCLPVFHVNHISDRGVHLTVMNRLKRYGHDPNPEAERQVKAVQDLIWGRAISSADVDSTVKKTLLLMLETARQNHDRNPELYYGLDLAGDNPENFLFQEKANGAVQLVLTDVFARQGCPVSPDWDSLRDKLKQDSAVFDCPGGREFPAVMKTNRLAPNSHLAPSF